MSIEIANYQFEGPFSSPSSLKNRSGVYAILCSRAGSYTVTDVGESAEVRDRVENHDRTDCWDRNCSGSIRYAALYTPNLQQSGRKKIEKKIREQYDPPCGEL